MSLMDQLHHHSKRVAAVAGAVTAIAAIIVPAVAGYAVYVREFEPLPRLIAAQNEKIAKLEDRLSKLDGQSSAAQRWVGTWRGKWNDTWKVQFQIFYTFGNTYLIVYSHQEFENTPLVDRVHSGTAEGSVLTWGDGYTIRLIAPNAAEAVGIFQTGKGVKAALAKAS